MPAKANRTDAIAVKVERAIRLLRLSRDV